MAYIGNQNYQAYVTLNNQTFTTSGSTTIYALNYTVTNANNLDLYIGGSKQQPGVAYTASGNTLTLTTATSSSMYAVYLGQGIQTVTPGATSVGTTQMNYPLGNFRSTGITDNASTTALTIDSSGNVGIGTTPNYRLQISASSPTNSIIAYLGNSQGASTRARIALQDASTTYAPDLGSVGNNITFDTVGAEAMRIDSSGNVLIGYSTLPTYPGVLNVNGNISWGNQSGKGRIYTDANWGCIIQGSKASPNGSAFLFINASDTSLLQFNGALGTGTVYSSSGVLTNTNPSDATLKTNVQDLSLGLNFITKLRPVTFNWINDRADQKMQYGFIAQEVQEIESSIVKEFEHIESDNPDNVEKSIKLGIEEKAINTALVKAIQEQQTLIVSQSELINSLTARVTALEAK